MCRIAYGLGPALGHFARICGFGNPGSRGHARFRGDGCTPVVSRISTSLARLPGLPNPVPLRQVLMGGSLSPVLCGGRGRAPESSPGTYPQNLHQGRSLASGSDRAASSRCSSETSCRRLSSSCSCASIRSLKAVTRSPLSWPGKNVPASIVTLQAKPLPLGICLASSSPLRIRLRMVSGDTSRCLAASDIESSMVPSMGIRVSTFMGKCLAGGYADSGSLHSPAVVPSW